MKAILKFDLNNPDDQMNHMRAIKSLDMALVLFEIEANLKRHCKNVCDCLEADSDKYDGMEVVLTRIREIFIENNINIEELIR